MRALTTIPRRSPGRASSHPAQTKYQPSSRCITRARRIHEPAGRVMGITLDIPEELVEQIARRAADLVAERQPSNGLSPWLSAPEAAERLRCDRDRIYDLIALGKLKPRRDGRRVLLHRDDLDAYLDASR
jgi:excisionase family DNA binding protein